MRTRLIITTVVAVPLLAILGLVWFTYSVLYAEPNIVVDYGAQLNELAAANQPEGDNAWPYFIEAVETFEQVTDEMFDEASAREKALREANQRSGIEVVDRWSLYRDYFRILYGPSDRSRWDVELEELSRMRDRGVFDLALEASKRPRMVMPQVVVPDEEHDGMLYYGLLSFRSGYAGELGQALAAEMRLAADAEDRDRHLDSMSGALGLARHIAAQPALIYQSIAWRVHRYSIDELRYELLEYNFDEKYLRSVLETLEEQELPRRAIATALEGERIVLLDAIQHWYTGKPGGAGRAIVTKLAKADREWGGYTSVTLADEPTFSERWTNFRAFSMPGRIATRARVDSYIDKALAIVDRPLTDIVVAEADLRDESRPSYSSHYVLSVLLPPVGQMFYRDAISDLHQRAATLMVALEIARHRDGEYPTSLEELTPDILDELPVEPVSGGAWGYRRIDPAADPHGRGYLLYTVGLDGVDDGGVEATAEDLPDERDARRAPLLSADAAGYDYILNSPRPNE